MAALRSGIDRSGGYNPTDDEENILYDIVNTMEWPESASVLPAEEGHSLFKTLAALARACFNFAVDKLRHPFSSFRHSLVPPSTLISLIGSRLPWQLAITSDGSLLAVLREDLLEIRSIEDDFEIVSATCAVEKDPRPQWRKLVWSEDGSLVAVGTSYGSVHVFTSNGRSVGSVPGRTTPAISDGDVAPLVHAVVGLAFIPVLKRAREEGMPLLAVLHYGGSLDTYQLRSQTSPLHLHGFPLLDYYPHGVASMAFHHRLNILIVGSCPADGDSLAGVSGWRMLDDAPYWAPLPGQRLEKKPKTLFGNLKPFKRPTAYPNKELVLAMSISPDGSLLATIEVSGRLSLWDVPSFRLRRAWNCEEQPTSTEPVSLPPFGSTAPKTNQGPPLLLDVSWWSDEALILVNTAGEVTVPSIISLHNLLGKSPEPGSCVTPAHDGQFFMLECESRRSAVGHYRLPSLSEEEEEEEGEQGEEEDEKFSLTRVSTNFLKQMLYFFTESERFRPAKKKPRVVLRKYRLACLKSMPPEECYERKMQQEEYEEALLLARQYGLDCDLVYQRQWQNHPVSIATIRNYLSKISKHQWVLQECLGRVPEEYDAVRELLQYGLIRTAFTELKEAELEHGEPTVGETATFDDPQQRKAQLSTEQIEEEISKWERLTPEQVSLCQYRHMLLTYLDRLSTYEVILGGPSAADEHFDATTFLQFRSSNLVKVAIDFARDSDWRALGALFTYHGDLLLPHRLAILSNIPETTPPEDYKFLLPALDSIGELETWKMGQHRKFDWVETQTVRRLCVLPNEAKSNMGEFLYEENPAWRQYESPVSADVLTSWYIERAMEIEKYSGQIDNALGLIKLGVDRGVKGLEVVHHQLQTLRTLVYQCNVDSRLSLTRLQNMSTLEMLQIMMKESSGPDFIQDFCVHAVPFLMRVDQLQLGDSRALVDELLTSIAKDDLAPCLAVFQQCNGKGPASAHDPVISDTGELMKLVLRCIYACQRSDQLEIADKIVECLPLRSPDSSKELAELHFQVDKLEDHLSALDILNTYGVHKPVNYIRDIQDNEEEAQALMVKLTRVASRQQPPLSEPAWRNLLQHLLSLKTRVFNCLDQTTCYKVFSESLLCSGSPANIHLASQLLSLSPSPSSSHPPPCTDTSTEVEPPAQGFTYRLPSETSLQLVLSAAKEYFNSASSLMDKDMDLARACLDLFPAPPHLAVQSELNLIASLSLLDDFSVGLLPVQVRLCENKLDMIRRVLDVSSTSYKKYDKILQLAHLLGLEEAEFEEDEASGWGRQMSNGRGHTLILVTLVAIEQGDFKLAPQLCSQLMEAHFPPAWEVCRLLGCHGKYKDFDGKMVLLDFALTHCPPEEIPQILKDKSLVEVLTLSLCCQGLLLPSSAVPRGAAVQQLMGRGVQQIVSKGAGAMQHLMGQRFVGATEQAVSVDKSPSKALEECLSWLQEATSNLKGSESLPVSPAYYPFYAQFSKVESDSSQISYSALKPAPVRLHLALNQAVLRAVSVANTLSCGEQIQDCTQVLLDLAEGCSQADTQLMLGYLLSLSQPSQADKFFSKMEPSKFSLQLAIFYMCLQLCSTSTTSVTRQQYPYLHLPSEVVEQTTSCMMSREMSDKEHSLVELLKQYQELLADHTQADVLQSLGLGIDVQQFTQDPEYKCNTILSLARTGDTAVMTTALSLAQRHNIPEWELYMAMLDWLLADSGLTPQEIQKKTKEVEFTKVLLQNPQQTADALQSSTHPKLPGTKCGILALYYSLLQQCREGGAEVEGVVDPDTHIKLIKKLKSSVPGLDYKAMMSGEDPLSVLQPVLLATNVHVVAKLANKIPSKEHGTLTSGMVFQAFAEKLFWTGDEKHRRPQSTADWVHRYEACHEYLGQLSAEDFLLFVHNIALSPQALMIGLETRTELVNRATKTACQRVKPGSEEVMPTSASQDVSFEAVALSLQQNLKHLQSLTNPELKIPIGVSEELWDHFMQEFDLTLSQPQKVHILAISMIEKGLPMTTVGTVLYLANRVHTHTLTVTGLVNEVLQKNLDLLSETSESLTAIERVLSAVSQHEKEIGTLASSGDVLAVLRPYCSEHSNPGSSRRALLQLMEKHLQLSQQDSDLLLLYQTQSLLAGHFSVEVSVDSISSPGTQQRLFTILLKEAGSVDQLKILASLLETWQESGFHIQCWLDLLRVLVSKPEGMAQVVTIRAGLSELPQEVDEELFSNLLANSTLDAMKFALTTSRDALIHQALRQLKLDNANILFDADLLELIIVKEKVSVITTTPLYPVLCKYLQCSITGSLNTEFFARLLHCPKSQIQERSALLAPAKRLQKVVKQLYEADFVVEAGSLFLSAQFFHPGLQTVNTALGFVDRL